MSEIINVLLVGWNPDFVDYNKWPGLVPEKLRAGLEGDRNKMNSLGYDAKFGLIGNADTASKSVIDLLSEKPTTGAPLLRAHRSTPIEGSNPSLSATSLKIRIKINSI